MPSTALVHCSLMARMSSVNTLEGDVHMFRETVSYKKVAVLREIAQYRAELEVMAVNDADNIEIRVI